MTGAPQGTGAGWRRWLLAFGVALAVLAGPAFPTYRHYDFSHSRDTLTYLSLARGEYRSLSVTRRYRVVVPWLAAALASPARLAAESGRLASGTSSSDPQTDAPLRLAFLLVNTLLLAAAGALVWRTAEAAGAAPLAAGLAMAVALSSRWATYAAALPLTDSLYCLCFALAFYGVRARAGWALVVALLLGPLAKESFIFLIPWVLWFGRGVLPWPRLLGALTLGCLALVAAHTYVDARAGAPASASVTNAVAHAGNLIYSLRRLFSAHGVAEIFSIFGFGWLLLLVRRRQPWGALLLRLLQTPGAALIGVVAVHMLLSGDLGRMGYLAFPVFGVAVALGLSRWSGLSGAKLIAGVTSDATA